MPNSNDAVLEGVDLAKEFVQGGVTLQVLRAASIRVAAGERIAIVGASGSGKTTLLQVLGGLDLPTRGTVRIAGSAMNLLNDTQRGHLRNHAVGFVYQFHHLLPEFTALENIALPQMVAGKSEQEANKRALELLTKLGLAPRAGHLPGKLSGGEQQRVAIARALANRPSLLLADEPTGNLDVATADIVFSELIRIVRAENVAALIATHNPDLARRMDRQITLRDGKLYSS